MYLQIVSVDEHGLGIKRIRPKSLLDMLKVRQLCFLDMKLLVSVMSRVAGSSICPKSLLDMPKVRYSVAEDLLSRKQWSGVVEE